VNTTFPTQAPKAMITSPGPSGIGVADFNGDGLPDIVVGSGYNTFEVTVLLSTPQ
jgi:hypothetical protein